jgi:hypothetical protein
LIVIRDPTTNMPFPGNKILPSRISAQGQGLLDLFPVPGPYDPTHSYNDVFQSSIDEPHSDTPGGKDWRTRRRILRPDSGGSACREAV